MCSMRLAGNTGRKNDAKNRRLHTIAQLCRAISLQLRHVSTIGKKLVKQQYLPHMSLHYGELRPTSGWDRFVSLGHPSKFQRVSLLGSVTAQPNCGVNIGRHLYLTGRPSRWALAHVSSLFFICCRCWILLVQTTTFVYSLTHATICLQCTCALSVLL